MKRFTLLAVVAAATITAVVLGVGGASSAATPAIPTVTVSLNGTSISVGGTLTSGAVNVTTTTTAGDGEPTFVHLNPGVTADQAFNALIHAPDPNSAAPYGQIVFDADAPHGTTTEQTILPAGNYLVADTNGNDPTKFPHTAVTIGQSSSPAALPAAGATVNAIEFGFKAPRTLHDGETVRFHNRGWLVHMVAAVRAKNHSGAKKILRLLKAGKDKKAEKLAKGFTMFLGPVSHDGVAQETITEHPGYYVLACFMDTQDHREHTRLGMVKIIRIKG